MPVRVLPPNTNFTVLVYGYTKSPLGFTTTQQVFFIGSLNPLKLVTNTAWQIPHSGIIIGKMVGICALPHSSSTQDLPSQHRHSEKKLYGGLHHTGCVKQATAWGYV